MIDQRTRKLCHIELDENRGLLINNQGSNRNVWVQRATMAHELGHLLWDPKDKLTTLRVDDDDILVKASEDIGDYVEQRANAFAAEFLAPKEAVAETYRNSSADSAVRQVMEIFGVSFSIARYQLFHGFEQKIALEQFRTSDWNATQAWEGTQAWEATEAYTETYFPIERTPIERRGVFSSAVALAEKEGLISTDTALRYLGGVQEKVYRGAREDIIGLYQHFL